MVLTLKYNIYIKMFQQKQKTKQNKNFVQSIYKLLLNLPCPK